MISCHHRHCQKLAVGKPEYKAIIETSLVSVNSLCLLMIVENFEDLICCNLFQPGLPCLFDETLMEVMMGLKNLMHSLVPQENVKLAEEDCLPMCQGIKKS